MKSASGDLHFGDGTFGIDHFVITRDEGRGTGAFSYTPARHEIKIDHVETTLSPKEAIVWIEPRFLEHVVPYRFHHTPHVLANGIVQLGAGKQTHLQLDISAPGGMDYTFIDKVLPFDQIAGTLLFTDDRLQIMGLKGQLFDGRSQRRRRHLPREKRSPLHGEHRRGEGRFPQPDRALLPI